MIKHDVDGLAGILAGSALWTTAAQRAFHVFDGAAYILEFSGGLLVRGGARRHGVARRARFESQGISQLIEEGGLVGQRCCDCGKGGLGNDRVENAGKNVEGSADAPILRGSAQEGVDGASDLARSLVEVEIRTIKREALVVAVAGIIQNPLDHGADQRQTLGALWKLMAGGGLDPIRHILA